MRRRSQLINDDRAADGRPVVDARHVAFSEVDAAMGAAIEGGRIVVRQVRAGAELAPPVGVVQEESIIGVEDAVVDLRWLVVQWRVHRIRRREDEMGLLVHRVVQTWWRWLLWTPRRHVGDEDQLAILVEARRLLAE